MTNIDALVIQYQTTKDLKVRDQIVMDSLVIVYAVAKKYKMNHHYGDMINEGFIAIISACDTFEAGGKANFSTYATHCARGAMLDFIRLDRTIPVASKTMHSHNLSFHPVPKSHSEVLALSEKAGVSYDAATKYALMGNIGSVEQMNNEITGDVTLSNVIAQELNEKLRSLPSLK